MGSAAIEAAGAAAEAFRGIGIRIEDDVVVTGDAPDVLTAGAPTDPDAIAERMGRARS
jgi:Xaa-Pro aminopeptidase